MPDSPAGAWTEMVREEAARDLAELIEKQSTTLLVSPPLYRLPDLTWQQLSDLLRIISSYEDYVKRLRIYAEEADRRSRERENSLGGVDLHDYSPSDLPRCLRAGRWMAVNGTITAIPANAAITINIPGKA